MRISPENQHAVFHKKLAFREHQRILHDDLKLFPYKIQILQRSTDQNKAEQETFCEDICQRIENDPGLLDLKDLNNVDHCGLCGASATLPVSRNLATKH